MATFVKYLCSFIDRFFLIFVHYKQGTATRKISTHLDASINENNNI